MLSSGASVRAGGKRRAARGLTPIPRENLVISSARLAFTVGQQGVDSAITPGIRSVCRSVITRPNTQMPSTTAPAQLPTSAIPHAEASFQNLFHYSVDFPVSLTVRIKTSSRAVFPFQRFSTQSPSLPKSRREASESCPSLTTTTSSPPSCGSMPASTGAQVIDGGLFHDAQRAVCLTMAYAMSPRANTSFWRSCSKRSSILSRSSRMFS